MLSHYYHVVCSSVHGIDALRDFKNIEHQNDDNFGFFGQTELDQRQLPSKKLTNLLVGGANAVQRVKN